MHTMLILSKKIVTHFWTTRCACKMWPMSCSVYKMSILDSHGNEIAEIWKGHFWLISELVSKNNSPIILRSCLWEWLNPQGTACDIRSLFFMFGRFLSCLHLVLWLLTKLLGSFKIPLTPRFLSNAYAVSYI